MEERAAQAVLDAAVLTQGQQGLESLVHRRIVLRGQWLAQWTVFLDNRQMNAKPGFYVLTPFKLKDSAAVVMVQRGWAPRNFAERSRLPSVQTPTDVVEVQGVIAVAPARLYELGQAQEGPIRQNLDLAQYSTQTGLALAPVSIQQTGAPSEGLLRDWPAVNAGVDKHYGYAFQWFGLSALIALLYVWFQIARRIFPPQQK
jgi:surfeit locus 1 family protein